MKLTASRPAYHDEFGSHDAFESVWEPEIRIGDTCFVLYKRFGKYVIRELKVYEYWFTNIWGWKMSNGWCFQAADYGKTVFRYDELQKAIEICEKKNRLCKVKVIYR